MTQLKFETLIMFDRNKQPPIMFMLLCIAFMTHFTLFFVFHFVWLHRAGQAAGPQERAWHSVARGARATPAVMQ